MSEVPHPLGSCAGSFIRSLKTLKSMRAIKIMSDVIILMHPLFPSLLLANSVRAYISILVPRHHKTNKFGVSWLVNSVFFASKKNINLRKNVWKRSISNFSFPRVCYFICYLMKKRNCRFFCSPLCKIPIMFPSLNNSSVMYFPFVELRCWWKLDWLELPRAMGCLRKKLMPCKWDFEWFWVKSLRWANDCLSDCATFIFMLRYWISI